MEIEIPFGARDSKLKGWEYTIPEGMEAVIEDGKIIVKEKESEDERIRKEIIEYLWDISNQTSLVKESLDCRRWIAYLEKQKEQPADAKSKRVIKAARRVLNNWLDGTDYPDVSGDFAELEYAIREYDGEEKQKPNIEICPHSIKSKSYSEQKPESCDPDTNVEKVIEEVIRVYGKTQGEWIGGYDIDMLIVNLRRAFNMKSQKPAEWSKEDEKDMAHIIRILDDCYAYGKHDLSKTDHENLVNKLKSLRPQPHSEWRHYIWATNLRFDFTALIKYDNTDNYEIVQAGNRPKQEKNGVYILIKDIKPQPHWKPSEEQMNEILKED